jgi:hypothetical protein
MSRNLANLSEDAIGLGSPQDTSEGGRLEQTALSPIAKQVVTNEERLAYSTGDSRDNHILTAREKCA